METVKKVTKKVQPKSKSKKTIVDEAVVIAGEEKVEVKSEQEDLTINQLHAHISTVTNKPEVESKEFYVMDGIKSIPLSKVKVSEIPDLLTIYNVKIARKKHFISLEEERLIKAQNGLEKLINLVKINQDLADKYEVNLINTKAQIKTLEAIYMLLQNKLLEANGIEGGIFTGAALDVEETIQNFESETSTSPSSPVVPLPQVELSDFNL